MSLFLFQLCLFLSIINSSDATFEFKEPGGKFYSNDLLGFYVSDIFPVTETTYIVYLVLMAATSKISPFNNPFIDNNGGFRLEWSFNEKGMMVVYEGLSNDLKLFNGDNIDEVNQYIEKGRIKLIHSYPFPDKFSFDMPYNSSTNIPADGTNSTIYSLDNNSDGFQLNLSNAILNKRVGQTTNKFTINLNELETAVTMDLYSPPILVNQGSSFMHKNETFSTAEIISQTINITLPDIGPHDGGNNSGDDGNDQGGEVKKPAWFWVLIGIGILAFGVLIGGLIKITIYRNNSIFLDDIEEGEITSKPMLLGDNMLIND